MRHSRRQLRDAGGADAASTASAASVTGQPAFPWAAAPGAPAATRAATSSERAPTASVSTAECAHPKHVFWCSTYSPLALGPALARVPAGLATNGATGFWPTAAATACSGALVAHSTATFCSADTTFPSWAALRTGRPILAIPAAPTRPNSSAAATRSDAYKPA